jgi:hypothetical protein
VPPRFQVWLYRLTLVAFPKAFRDECGNEMLATLRSREQDIRRRTGGSRLLRFWSAELFAVLRSGLRMRVQASRHRRSSRAPQKVVFPRRESKISSILQDVKFAARSFRKMPGLTSVVVVTLALGIGANAAVLPFLYGILIRPLPFDKPDQLAVLFENAPGFTRASPSYPNYLDWRDRSTTFSGRRQRSRWHRMK